MKNQQVLKVAILWGKGSDADGEGVCEEVCGCVSGLNGSHWVWAGVLEWGRCVLGCVWVGG